MLQNKIYQNFIKEIIKTFFIILFGLTIIAWTVRAVNFLDLIVENGYSITTYFQYSFLNLFGILTKFIPLAFLIALLIFIIKQIRENEFIILWVSGVKKLKIVNLFFFVSILVLFFYLIFSTFLTPLALNKSRVLLSKDGFNSLLPTIRIQQFSDSFQGFTFLVEKKINDEIKNVFIHDRSNVLKNLTTDQSKENTTTIVANEGLVQEKRMILFNGSILTTNRKSLENNIVKFQQLNIDLKNLQTDTITSPKLQETSTINLSKCLLGYVEPNFINCKESSKKEIMTTLNRRLVLPLYIPVISLLCSFLLIQNKRREKKFINQYSVFTLSFLVLLYAELIIRYTGISQIISIAFIVTPFILIALIYFLLIIKTSKESFNK
jgi:lipopolysaccharide export system permease protein